MESYMELTEVYKDLIDVGSDKSNKEKLLASLIMNDDLYKFINKIVETYNLEIFNKYSSPNYTTINIVDNDSFDKLSEYENDIISTGKFDIYTKETDSNQSYVVIAFKFQKDKEERGRASKGNKNG